MLEMGTSGLMSGEGKPPAASRSRSSALPRLYGLERVAVGASKLASYKLAIAIDSRGIMLLNREHDRLSKGRYQPPGRSTNKAAPSFPESLVVMRSPT